jgi:hypothetical protein
MASKPFFSASKEEKPTLDNVFVKQENSQYENCIIDKLNDIENLPEEFTGGISEVIDKLASWKEGEKKPNFVYNGYRYGAFFSKNIGTYTIWRVKMDAQQQGGGGGRGGYNKPAILYHLTGLYECTIGEAAEVIAGAQLEKGEYLTLSEPIVLKDTDGETSAERIVYVLKKQKAFIAGSDPVAPAATAAKTGGGQS